ncbi:hypothetical protein LSAT2_001667 [Lamellibrachia satsuma]|nr:hypothetical protein LSAT2_001667 [Lamellibrachia satsuma]
MLQSLCGAQECVKREERLCSELEQEKIRLTELPYTDPEYKRLQADLEASRNDDLETLCRSLQQQRQELQQQLWQQELAKKRKQQQRDQSNYKQWQRLGQADDQETSSQVDLSQPEPVKQQTRPNIGRITQAIRSSKTRKLSGSNQSQS